MAGAIALAVLTPAAARAQIVSATVSADSITVGDRFTLTLRAEHRLAVAPSFPDPVLDSTRFGDLVVLDVVAAGGRSLAPAGPIRRLDSVVYEVTTFALDTARVPPLPVGFTVDEDTFSVASLPLLLPVTSLVPPDAQGIRDLAPLVPFPRPLWPYVLLGLALLVLAVALFLYLRERRRRPEPEALPPEASPAPSTYEAALARLRALEATADLDDPEQAKPFYVELSDVLRTYLEQRLGVPALERTTRELLQELEQRTVRYRLPGPAPGRIRQVLELADLAKFAEFRPPTEAGRDALAETRKTLDGIETKLRQIANEPPAPPEIQFDAQRA